MLSMGLWALLTSTLLSKMLTYACVAILGEWLLIIFVWPYSFNLCICSPLRAVVSLCGGDERSVFNPLISGGRVSY